MAGHSKWNNIKNKKGKEDARRGQIFTKLSRMISVAVKEGGTDPSYNPALQSAIDKAKAENMPNDNIERAIKRAAGEDADTHYEEVWYEGYGPEGVAVIVQCLTDNRNRTAPDIRHAFDKYGGNLGQTGSVTFLFERKGVLIADEKSMPEDDFLCMRSTPAPKMCCMKKGITKYRPMWSISMRSNSSFCLQGSNLSVWILRFCRRHPPLFRMKKPDQYGKTD